MVWNRVFYLVHPYEYTLDNAPQGKIGGYIEGKYRRPKGGEKFWGFEGAPGEEGEEGGGLRYPRAAPERSRAILGRAPLCFSHYHRSAIYPFLGERIPLDFQLQ